MPLFPPSLDSFQVAWSAIADGTAINTTAETSLMASATVGARVIPANWLQPGRTIRTILNGSYNSPTLPGSMTIRVKIGSTVIATATSSTLLSLAVAKGMQISTTFTCRQSGPSTTLATAGTFQHGIAAAGRSFYDVQQVADVTIDGTVDQTLDITAQMSALSTDASITIKTGTVEFLTQ